MSRKFYAVHKQTCKRWTPNKAYVKNYLVMYDSGYLAEVFHEEWGGISIYPLSPAIWQTVIKDGEI